MQGRSTSESWVISVPGDYFWKLFLLRWPESKLLKQTHPWEEETLTFLFTAFLPQHSNALVRHIWADAKKMKWKLEKYTLCKYIPFYHWLPEYKLHLNKSPIFYLSLRVGGLMTKNCSSPRGCKTNIERTAFRPVSKQHSTTMSYGHYLVWEWL